MDSSIAEKLIALRVQRGLSQAELAAKLGKEPQIIAGWENRDISPDNIIIDNVVFDNVFCKYVCYHLLKNITCC